VEKKWKRSGRKNVIFCLDFGPEKNTPVQGLLAIIHYEPFLPVQLLFLLSFSSFFLFRCFFSSGAEGIF
jgi:hypothetical protein